MAIGKLINYLRDILMSMSFSMTKVWLRQIRQSAARDTARVSIMLWLPSGCGFHQAVAQFFFLQLAVEESILCLWEHASSAISGM